MRNKKQWTRTEFEVFKLNAGPLSFRAIPTEDHPALYEVTTLSNGKATQHSMPWKLTKEAAPTNIQPLIQKLQIQVLDFHTEVFLESAIVEMFEKEYETDTNNNIFIELEIGSTLTYLARCEGYTSKLEELEITEETTLLEIQLQEVKS